MSVVCRLILVTGMGARVVVVLCSREVGSASDDEDGNAWSDLQLARLRKAQLSVPTTAPSFWDKVCGRWLPVDA